MRVSVTDEGNGIASEEQPHIFERFYRVVTPDMENLPGMGLGLYISAQIVVQHKGELTVESHSGKGSTFTFTVPVG